PPPPPPPKPTTPAVQPDTGDSDRPEGLAFALGVGYTLPTSLQTPNTTTARLRLASGMTFEPGVIISNGSATMDTGTTSMTTKETDLKLDMLLRFPIVKHGKVDLEILGGAGFEIDKTNPDGDYNTKTVTKFDLLYGLGIGYWITHHWQFSM